MKIALAQINPTIGAYESNLAKIRKYLEEAQQNGASLVVFPELALSGYPPKDLLEKKAFVEKGKWALQELASHTNDTAVIVGFIEHSPPYLFNSAALIHRGKVQGIQRKSLLPTYDVFDEHRHFRSGEERHLFEILGQKIAILICEDAWSGTKWVPLHHYGRNPVEEIQSQSPSLVVHISASPYEMGKIENRTHLLGNIAEKCKVPVVSVNQVGGQDDLLFDGTSLVVSPDKEILARGVSFAEDLIYYDTEAKPGKINPPLAPKEEEILQALVMGTRDYTHKCGFKKALVGLSGGIDSTLVAVIAVWALGAENVMGISMPSQFSSPGSRNDADQLAKNLEIEYHSIPIRSMYDSFMEHLDPIFAGRPFGLAEENLQARIRGQLLMSVSNKLGSLVFTTGNKSELAVGYCTLYGDMSGGLAVISDVPKTLVYQLCQYINRKEILIPPEVITKPPSAELRPDQKDSDSLPAYHILDEILRLYVEEQKGFQEIVEAGFSPDVVKDILKKVDLNEYKRKMAAPGLRITSKAFGSGRRMPIAQGFFREQAYPLHHNSSSSTDDQEV